ncbi:10423_t:CDS:2 [Cetraspora pellucida]|uniref:10423_t:CDS:1 n=1 Tax=Cetraspora pellucida TaxID=1433469 RepID=A0A9N9ISZ8_9GLOM|nr:10423_t:CDS:2 [Cetraspora pellucida]
MIEITEESQNRESQKRPVIIDEIRNYVKARWVSAPEAAWRILGFKMNGMNLAVMHLQVHLSNQQRMFFDKNSNLVEVVTSERERYYLRLLLMKVKGARNFEELKTVDGIIYSTFKESIQHRGFLENNNEYQFCISEAREFQMPNQLRNLFATLLIFGNIVNVSQLWNENFNAMAEDFIYNRVLDGQFKVQAVLQSLNSILQRYSKSVSDFDLLELLHFNVGKLSRIHLEELNYQIFPEDLAKADTLNEG